MTQARWAVDGPDGTSLELGGRKFSSNDEGAPMLCNLVCSSLGRHVHIDYCRASGGRTCSDAEVQHLGTRITPDANRPKDAVTHGLSWRRMGLSCFHFSCVPCSLTKKFRLQRSYLLYFFADTLKETGTQTHTLVTNKRILKIGVLASFMAIR